MSTAGNIRFAGIASGLDVDSMVNSLMQIESIPVTRMQRSIAQLQAKQGAYNSIRSQLQSFNSAVANLATAGTYNPVKSSVADTTIATISTSSTAAAGTYQLKINTLAQAHKVASAAQTSATEALNLTGQFVVNGKSITATAADTLTSLASKINSAGSGVTASVINGGTGQAYLSFSAQKSGASNAMQFGDLTGGVLSSLGVTTGAKAVRNAPAANTALSYGFKDSSSNIGTLLGYSGNGTIDLNGTTVSLDFATDSLQTVADKINTAATGITATVESSTSNGSTSYHLKLSGATVPSGITDTSNLLEGLGVLQRSFGNQLLSAQDASFELDGLALQSSTNQVTNVVPGVTLNLLKKDSTTKIDLTRDTSAIKSSVSSIVSAYNSVVDAIKSVTSYDKETKASGALLGDQTISAIEQGLFSSIFASSGNGAYTNLTQLGFGTTNDGKLEINDAKLEKAITENLPEVQKLLMATGQGSSTSINYVSSGEKTKTSPGSGYEVNVTTLATKTNFIAAMAQTSPLAASETLTFGGALFGGTNYNLSLESGLTSTQVMDRLNADSKLKDLIVASIDSGGFLQINSKRFGAGSAFTLSSSIAAGANTTGLGGGTVTNGVDTAGTIGGETATGSGQFLIGASGNTNTEGLQIQYTGTTTGVVGSVTFNSGAANSIRGKVSSYLDSVSGMLTTQDKSIQSQIDDITERISSTQELLALRRTTLQRKFAAMESALAQLQSQSSSLTNIQTTSAASG